MAALTPEYWNFLGEPLMAEAKLLEAFIRDRCPNVETIELSVPYSNRVYIANLRIKEGFRSRGCGTRAVHEIQEFATKKQLPVTLVQAPDRGKQNALRKFYERCGFFRNVEEKYMTPNNITYIWWPPLRCSSGDH